MILDSAPPGYLPSLGLGYSDLSESNPALVMASITPFGQEGPYRDYASTDLTALAFGGPVWSCGYDDHDIPPVRGGGNQAYHTVGHYAVAGIMVALVHRQFTGAGQYIDANMHAALNITTEAATYSWLVAGTRCRADGTACIRDSDAAGAGSVQGRTLRERGDRGATEEQWFHLLAWMEEEGLVENLGIT